MTVAPDPLRTRTVHIKLHAVSVRITEINRFTHAMVGGAGNWIITPHQPVISVRQVFPPRITHGEMVKSSGSRRAEWGGQGLGPLRQPPPPSSSPKDGLGGPPVG